MANTLKGNKELKKPPKGAAAPKDDDENEVTTGSLPSGDFVKKHLKSVSKLKSDARSIAGQIGAEVKNAEADENVHRGAFAWALKLAGMDEEKRAEHLRHFDSYRLQLGFGRQDDLFNDPSPADAATFAGR